MSGLVTTLVLVLVAVTSARAQKAGEVAIHGRANLRGLPMVGAAYHMSERLDVRLMTGYLRGNSWDRPPCGFGFCQTVTYRVLGLPQYSGVGRQIRRTPLKRGKSMIVESDAVKDVLRYDPDLLNGF